MNKRETLLKLIELDVAEHGEHTEVSIRIYCGHKNISYKAMKEAGRRGLKLYNAKHAPKVVEAMKPCKHEGCCDWKRGDCVKADSLKERCLQFYIK